MIEVTQNGIVSTGTSIPFVTKLAQKHALALEMKGLKRHGRSMYSLVKEFYGLKGNKQKVYDQFSKLVEEQRAEEEARLAKSLASRKQG